MSEPCDTIRAEITVYEAAISVDHASVTVTQNQLNADQTAYNYWTYQSYMNGCSSGAASADQPDVHSKCLVSPARMKQMTADFEAVRMRHAQEILKENAHGG